MGLGSCWLWWVGMVRERDVLEMVSMIGKQGIGRGCGDVLLDTAEKEWGVEKLVGSMIVRVYKSASWILRTLWGHKHAIGE